jgi:hypothetical protein
LDGPFFPFARADFTIPDAPRRLHRLFAGAKLAVTSQRQHISFLRRYRVIGVTRGMTRGMTRDPADATF